MRCVRQGAMVAVLGVLVGCHLLLPLGQPGDEGADLSTEGATNGDSQGADVATVPEQGLPCADPAQWTCSPGTMPPACILTCDARELRCVQLLGNVTCTCKLNGTELCPAQTFSMVGVPACQPIAFAFLCTTALQKPELACCRQ